jgi:GTP-binding protein HflX
LVQVALVRIEIDVPYDSGSIIGEVRKSGVVESEVYGQDGTRVVAHVPPPTARRLAHLAVKGDSMSSMETLDVGVVQEKEEWSREDEEAFLALTLEEETTSEP